MLGLRGRIGIAALAAAGTAAATVLLVVGSALRERAVEEARESLVAQAALLAHLAEGPLAGGLASAELDRIVDAAGREGGGRRYTVIAPDGRVLADSSVSGPALLLVENHRGRHEVEEAIRTGRGTALRRSATVSDELLYAAAAIRREGRLLGVARVAFPLRGVEAQAADLRRAVAVALAIALAVTAALAAALSSPLAGPLGQIMDSARRFAAGDLGARSPVRRTDEIGELARILNRSADQLQARLVEIERGRARVDAILSSMEEGLLAVDHAGTVLLANDTLRRSLAPGEPVGRHFLEALRQGELAGLVDDVLRTGQRRETEILLPRVRRAYALTAAPFPGAEGAPHGAVITFHDVTERRRLEQVRRDFVANASHELRTPLTSIRGFVEALEDGAAADPVTAQRFLAKIRTHADRMAALVKDLLELSRAEAGERTAGAAERIAPAEAAAEVSASLSDLARARKVTVLFRDGGAPEVHTDADRLRRILENLVENGIKYTREGGHVTVTTRPAEDGGAAFEVQDDGPGIPPEHLARIFERFYRVDKARSRELGGTGLGLAIVKHLAESIQARVDVRSQVGAGTTFTVVLPPRPGPP